MKLNLRILLAFIHDLAVCGLAWLAAFWLRFTPDPIPDPYWTVALTTLIWVVPLHAALFLGIGLYRGIWRFASVPDLKRIVIAAAAGAAASALLLLMLQVTVPRTVLILLPVLLVLVMGGDRFAYRMWKERRWGAALQADREPVAVIGAGEETLALLKDLARSPQWRVAALFDDDATKIGRELHGVRVLGPVADIGRHCARLSIRHAIISMPTASYRARRRAVELCSDAALDVMTVPSYEDLVSGKVTVSQIRHVELDDLLGRAPVVLDTERLNHWLGGRCVMVTGAGGSIGAELCRQIARFKPGRLVLFEQGEFALYAIEQEFNRVFPGLQLACAIGDVKDAARVADVLAAYKPSAIFHAAAYKHVPLMEEGNAWQAVRNNVAGTLVMAQAAIQAGVEKFVLVSTDKAVNPTSVMGASKRLAEMACQALQQPLGTHFVMVRFGNVLGSAGSVIPKFREQIAAGGPVTVTHPEMRRYFMSIPEAAQLVLQAGLMGNGGEIFVLEMGEPVLIADLARDLIRLSGFHESDIRVVYTGLRPGEKLYEELLADDENTLPTPHPKLRIAKARSGDGAWLAELTAWLASADERDAVAVRRALARWMPEYRPS